MGAEPRSSELKVLNGHGWIMRFLPQRGVLRASESQKRSRQLDLKRWNYSMKSQFCFELASLVIDSIFILNVLSWRSFHTSHDLGQGGYLSVIDQGPFNLLGGLALEV